MLFVFCLEFLVVIKGRDCTHKLRKAGNKRMEANQKGNIIMLKIPIAVDGPEWIHLIWKAMQRNHRNIVQAARSFEYWHEVRPEMNGCWKYREWVCMMYYVVLCYSKVCINQHTELRIGFILIFVLILVILHITSSLFWWFC